MRLDPEQRSALEFAISTVECEVHLFGSRIDRNKKGGDIDILIFSEDNPFELSQKVAVRFFEKCEEKIDVVVMNPKKLTEEQKAFLELIETEQIK